MPSINTSVPHSLPRDEACSRLKRLLEYMREQYGDQYRDVTEEWTENVLNYAFKTSGMRIKGTMSVEPDKVDIRADVPLTAMMFKGQIEKTIRQQVEKVLRP